MRVSAKKAAIVTGIVASVYLVILLVIRPVPDWVRAVLGGPRSVARDGGLVLRYRPPASYDEAMLAARAARRRVQIEREADGVLAVEVPGVAEADASHVAMILTHGGLELREVISGSSLADFRHHVWPEIDVEIDQWQGSGTLASRTRAYLNASSPAQLTEALEQVQAGGWSPPPRSIIRYQHVERPGSRRPEQWHSFVLGDDVLLDGDAVQISVPSYGDLTGAIVRLQFDRAGSKRLEEITARLVDRKLAVVIAGQVTSSQVIRRTIRDGVLSIPVGGVDPDAKDRYRREAEALTAALGAVALPPGGTLMSQTWSPPASIENQLVLARLVLGVLGGALVGLVIGLLVRITRPVWEWGSRRLDGRFPIRRAAVTLLAPIAILLLRYIGPPGIRGEGEYILSDTIYVWHHISIIELGVTPILLAHVAVELMVVVTPRWRRMRFHPATRIARGRWVALVGIVLALIQSHLILVYLGERSPSSDVVAPNLFAHVAAMASLTTGTLLLVSIAGMIRQHGLGNGYGAVIVSGWAITLARQFLDDSSAGSPDVLFLSRAGHVLGLTTLAGIGFATMAMLRMRISEPHAAPLRVPSSGHVPLLMAVIVIGTWLITRDYPLAEASMYTVTMATASELGWWLVAALVVLVPVWALPSSRPATLAPFAARAGLAPPSWRSWWRATLLSLAILLAITAASVASVLTSLSALAAGDAVLAAIAAAVALDVRDDLRARRIALVAVWPLQHAQHAELVQRVLRDAGIECHLQASHLRTLLAFLGSYAPIDVLVPEASANEARARIEPLFSLATADPSNDKRRTRSVGAVFASALRPPRPDG